MMVRNLQALRAIAACAVLFIHLMATGPSLSKGLDAFKFEYWWYGPAGVDLFFVISGFIVTYTAARSAAQAPTGYRTALAFFAKRVIRIYPVYWIVLAIAFCVVGTLELAPNWLPKSSTLDLILLTTRVNDKVMLAWTLCYEMMFYSFLAILLFFSGRRFPVALAIWCILHSAVIILKMIFALDVNADDILFSPMILEFYLGCAVFFLYRRGIHDHAFIALLLGIVGFYVGSYGNRVMGGWAPHARTLAFGLPSALLVYAFVSLEKKDVILPVWLQRIGDASYSLYIWHQLVLATLSYSFIRMGLIDVLAWPAVLAIWLAVVFAVGFASYYGIERPIIRLLKARVATSATLHDPALLRPS